jgi:hypothetical protein
VGVVAFGEVSDCATDGDLLTPDFEIGMVGDFCWPREGDVLMSGLGGFFGIEGGSIAF